jgi:potassium uptake TrkH family protein
MKRVFNHPSRAIAFAFLVLIVVGTALLCLPIASASGAPAALITAFFTSVSAVCVTGLAIVDTGTYWSPFGQVVILGLVQVGGFGIMTGATLLGLLVNRSPRLRTKLLTQAESHTLGLGDVTAVAKMVISITLVSELILAVVLTARLVWGYGTPLDSALWSGIFHSISAFNNAGFSIHADGLMRYAADWMFLVPVMLAIFVGGIGFPVLHDIKRRLDDPRHWSLHTKLTLTFTFLLLVGGTLGILLFESTNMKTLGPMAWDEKFLNAAFASVSARTAGFNALDIGAMTSESWALHYMLMFVGGGSGGTAGGIKVGTIAILVLLILAEVRGQKDSEAFGRRVGSSAQRQATTVLMLGGVTVTIGTLALLMLSDFPTDKVIFEVVSAFGTVGLSTGITADLSPAAQSVLCVMMYLGRVGTITLAASLVLNERRMNYRYPEEHPIVG